jgi:hypothetical protein
VRIKKKQHTSVMYEFSEKEFQKLLGITEKVFVFHVFCYGGKVEVHVSEKNK